MVRVFWVYVLLACAAGAEVAARPRGDAQPGVQSLEAASLRSIAAWLRQSGRDGYLAADVADAAGIPRERSEDVLEARQRGFKSGDVLHVAQLSADERRDFLLFMVQQPTEVYFYLSSVREGFRKAFVFVPASRSLLALEPAEAQENFRREVLYWEQRVAGSL